MTDVERFFRRLVSNLAATDPGRLRGPVSLDEITRDILPYRTNRRTLGLDTSEDYELVLLRLCAGEGGLVRTEPEEARDRFAREIGSVNPDLDVLHSFETVELTLRREAVARALEAELETTEGAWADRNRAVAAEEPERLGEMPQPDEMLQPNEMLQPDETELSGAEALRGLPLVEESDSAEAAGADDPSCRSCAGALPLHRPVNFCPHCGRSQTRALCPECRGEVEPGWRHCVNCGAPVSAG